MMTLLLFFSCWYFKMWHATVYPSFYFYIFGHLVAVPCKLLLLYCMYWYDEKL